MVLLIATIVLFILYSVLLLYYRQSWKSIPVFATAGTTTQTKISVIIAARNEEENIGSLLEAMRQQSYPPEMFEVIVIDDHSTDKTASVVQRFNHVKLIRLLDDNINSYKKKAIETGIASASGEWIVTTDADCLPPAEWLNTIAAFKEEKNAVFVVAPVVIDCNSSLLQIFQAMDFSVLQGITGASAQRNIHSMCNGANLAYERKVFYEVNGFAGIDHIASGDDMLLMHKIWKKYPGNVHYLKSKDAIVATQPMKTWIEFFSQRIRWASKANRYDDKRIFWVLVLVYLFNLSFLVLAIATFWNLDFGFWILGLWVAKTLVELPFVSSVSSFFGKRSLVKYFFLLQPLHILYTIISGLFGQFGRYEWKGRKVK